MTYCLCLELTLQDCGTLTSKFGKIHVHYLITYGFHKFNVTMQWADNNSSQTLQEALISL